MLTKERIQERCQFWREKYTTVYNYDDHGRLTAVKDTKGVWSKVSYLANTSLAKRLESNDTFIESDYNLLTGELVTKRLPFGASYRYKYSTDGIVTDLYSKKDKDADEVELYHLSLPQRSCEDLWCIIDDEINTVVAGVNQDLYFDEFGRLKYSQTETSDGILNSGLKVYGQGDNVILAHFPHFDDNEKGLQTEYMRDRLGRLTRIFDKGNNKRMSVRYSRGCNLVEIDSDIHNSFCYDIFGNINNQYFNFFRYFLTINYLGDISSGMLPHEWKTDKNGFLYSTESTHVQPFNPTWDDKRSINIKQNTITYKSGFTLKYSPTGNLKRTNREDARPTDLFEDLDYENGLLKNIDSLVLLMAKLSKLLN